MIEDYIAHSVTFEFYHHTHPVSIGLISYFRNSFKLFFTHQNSNVFNQSCFIDLVGKLINDNDIPIALLFNMGFGSYFDTSSSRRIGIHNPFFTKNNSPRRKIGTFDNLQNIFNRTLRIVESMKMGLNNLIKSMGWDISSHTYGNTRTSIDKQIGDT